MNAWLLTWEGTASTVVSDNKIVAIVSSLRSSSTVEDLVDVLYCRTVDSAYDAVRTVNRKKKQRHRELKATFSTMDRIFYGRGPLIFARRVFNLKVVRNEANGTEIISWTDPPCLRIEKAGGRPVVADPERHCQIVRRINAPLSRDLHG